MHRTDADANASNLFSPGDPATGQPGTKIDSPWLNAVQEEICNVVTGAGISLIKGTWTQLKAAIDALISAAVNGSIVAHTYGTLWSDIDAGDSQTVVRKAGKLVSLILHAKAASTSSWTSVLTLPVGSRPPYLVRVACRVWDQSAATYYPAILSIGTDGVAVLDQYDNGTNLVVPFAIGTNDNVQACVAFLVA